MYTIKGSYALALITIILCRSITSRGEELKNGDVALI